MDLTIREIMSTDLKVVQKDDGLDLVRIVMKYEHIRHLPVVDKDDRFIGLLTHRDLLALSVSNLSGIDRREQAKLDENVLVREVMKTKVETISPELDVKEAARILLSHKYGCLPVVEEDGLLVGIVTEADFVKLVLNLFEYADEHGR